MAELSLSANRGIELVLGRSLVWRAGRWLYLGARRELLNEPRHNGEYRLQAWVVGALNGARNRPTFLDVGANVGDWTASLLATLEENGEISGSHIHAFEPAPAQFARLRQRFDAEIAASTVFVVPAAVGVEEGELPFFVTGNESGSSSLMNLDWGAPAERTNVTVTTIDRYMAVHDIYMLELLKIDTEGNDFNVIFGSRSAIAEGRIKVIQFEYNWRWIPFGHSMWKVFALARQVGYRVGKLTADGIEVYDVWHPELDRFIETNFVMIRADVLAKLPHRAMTFNTANTPVVMTTSPRIG